MAPLDEQARSDGRKAMEQKLTAAGRVRRKLKAGRPPATGATALDPLKALHYLATESDKARGKMREEGLDPDDIQLLLAYKVEQQDLVSAKPLPKPGEMRKFFAFFEPLWNAVEFLGIIWVLRDHETGRFLDWVTPMSGKPEDVMLLTAVRENAAKRSGKPLENTA